MYTMGNWNFSLAMGVLGYIFGAVCAMGAMRLWRDAEQEEQAVNYDEEI